MNKALQSYTPTVLPLDYDSLGSREGCEADSGNDIMGALAFTQVCVFSASGGQQFAQLDTVSYAVGPDVPGAPATRPHMLVWTAWVASSGIRIGVVGSVTPPANSLGVMSGLFPATVTTKLTHCFDSQGLLHMAIQKEDPGFIELKWYVDNSGTIADLSFEGNSPLLFDLSDVDPSGSAGVVCYYLRIEHPFVVFARFAQDNFATEQTIMPDLRINAVRLISIRSIGNIVKMYVKDDSGRDGTLTSPPYPLRFLEAASNNISFVHGVITQGVAGSIAISEKSNVAISFVRGMIYDATAEAHSITFESGEIDLAT
jgi:hypothetical protein